MPHRAILWLFLALLLGVHTVGPGGALVARAEDDEDAEEPEDPLAGFHRAPDPADQPGPAADLFARGLELQARGKYRSARRVFWELIDEYPDSPYAPEARDRSGPNAFLGITPMHAPRPSERRIDVALMGDGYRLDRQARFNKAAVGHLKVLLSEPTFAAYEPYFNFWRFNLASKDTGVDEVERIPLDEEVEERRRRLRRRESQPLREYDTALDCKAAGSQGQVAANPRRVWHYLSYLEVNDALAVCFAQKGRLGMGGMGIATTGPKGVVVHEFGHAFSGLLDEYAVNPGEPFGFVEGANATTNRQNPPWKHFLRAGVPGVGVYEGGATFQTGVWRPAPSCAMNTGGSRFCPVCREATILAIYTYVSPIDVALPAEKELVLGEEGWPAIEVQAMRPRTHELEVEFWFGPAPAATAASEAERTEEDDFADEMLSEEERRIWERLRKARRERGESESPSGLPSLVPYKPGLVRRTMGMGIEGPPPGETIRSRRRTRHGVRVHSPVLPDVPPGRWQLTAVVRDPTRPRGERFPWVLEDPRGLLEDRRAWTLVVPEPDEGSDRR